MNRRQSTAVRPPGIAVIMLLLAACDHPAGSSGSAGAPVSSRPATPVPPSRREGPRETCLERELKNSGLNRYGDPDGTVYAGGSPLMDERTGATMTRDEYVLSHHPELYRRCQQISVDGGT